MVGRLRSASMSRVFVPAWAQTIARFDVVSDLPSPDFVLETAMVWYWEPLGCNEIVARKVRNDSAATDCGLTKDSWPRSESSLPLMRATI